MGPTIESNPALGWQGRDGRSERVVVMLRPRSEHGGWTQLVVSNAIQASGGPGSPEFDGVSAETQEVVWRIATGELNGNLLLRGDWILQADGSKWMVQDVGLETGPYGQEQRPRTIKGLGSGAMPWQI